jgi:hypothetical protein
MTTETAAAATATATAAAATTTKFRRLEVLGKKWMTLKTLKYDLWRLCLVAEGGNGG